MSQPFTYLIGWPEHNTFYYGVRYARGCSPIELWTTYFTSSTKVKERREQWGEPTVKQVRKVFEDAISAKRWEDRVLRRLDARNHPLLLNQTSLPGPPHEKTPEQIEKIAQKKRGRPLTDEHKAKIGAANRGKTWTLSAETRARQSAAKLGVAKPEGFGEKVSVRMRGRVQSQEERDRRKASLTGRKLSPEHVRAVVAAKRKRRAELLQRLVQD